MGRKLANLIELPFFDKDDYLEDLFRQRGVGDSDWRQSLSREADELFIQDSISTNEAVLISHWRPIGLDVEFGTPADWLTDSFDKIVELYCECPAELAATRFKNRKRHEGHVDNSKSIGEVIDWFKGYEKFLPMNLGQTIVVDTSKTVNIQLVKENLIRARK